MTQPRLAAGAASVRADAQRVRHQRVRRAQRATEARRARARRKWRVLVHALLAR